MAKLSTNVVGHRRCCALRGSPNSAPAVVRDPKDPDADGNARVQVGHNFHRTENNFHCSHAPRPSEARKHFSTVPFLPDPDFVERPDVTAWLRDKCGRPPSRAALVGLGGIG